eukprot:Em0007g868a
MRLESRPEKREACPSTVSSASDERMPQPSSTAAYVQNGENDICDDGKEIAEAEDWESTVKENRTATKRYGVHWRDPFKVPALGAGRAITASLHKAKSLRNRKELHYKMFILITTECN